MSLFPVVNKGCVYLENFEHADVVDTVYVGLFRTWTTQKYEHKKVTVRSKYAAGNY